MFDYCLFCLAHPVAFAVASVFDDVGLVVVLPAALFDGAAVVPTAGADADGVALDVVLPTVWFDGSAIVPIAVTDADGVDLDAVPQAVLFDHDAIDPRAVTDADGVVLDAALPTVLFDDADGAALDDVLAVRVHASGLFYVRAVQSRVYYAYISIVDDDRY